VLRCVAALFSLTFTPPHRQHHALALEATRVRYTSPAHDVGAVSPLMAHCSDAVTQRLTAAEQAAAELATLQQTERLRAIADAAGYRPTVLQRLATGLALELRDGRPVVVEGETATPLATYAEREWADFLPSLLKTEPGAAFVRQGTTTTAPTDPVTAFITARNEARDKAPLPLKRS
jgi:hypothetical protein